MALSSAVRSQSPFADETFIAYPALSLMQAHAQIARTIQAATGINFELFDPFARSPFYLSTTNTSSSTAAVPTPISSHQDPFNNLSSNASSSTPTNPSTSLLPPNFHPTPSQLTVPHHPVLDLLPWPCVRERILQMLSQPPDFRPRNFRLPSSSNFDTPQPIILQILWSIKDAGGGLKVWGSDPFKEENWEIGEVFFRDFWWALERGIVERSNRLRERRGEGGLRF
ncbi:MAG: hypothetical protein Q9227_009293 [Pyrenula ochraceoflavens]